MLSKGGKIIYACGRCNGHEIERCGTVVRNADNGTFEILGMYAIRDDSYYCRSCGNFDWWVARMKFSKKKPIPHVKVDKLLREDDPRNAYRAFYNHEAYLFARIEVGGKPDFSMM